MPEQPVNPDAEKIKKILELKRKIEEKIAATREELKELQMLLELLDAALLTKSFKKLEVPPPKVEEETLTSPPAMEYETVIPLKTVSDELLANLYLGDKTMHVIIPPDKKFDINTPPFKAFLIERVLVKMQEKDQEAVRNGELSPDEMLSYNIIRENNVVRELIIRNVSPQRVRELKSSIRWTLEKMYEKASVETR